MYNNPVTTLDERLHILELECGKFKQNNKILRRAAVFLALAISTIMLSGSANQNNDNAEKSLDVHAIVIRDKDNHVRIALGVDEDGEAFVMMCDPKGDVCLEMGVKADSVSGLQLYDPQGTRRASMALSRDQGAGLEFRDKDDRVRTILGVEPDGSSLLQCYGQSRDQHRFDLVVKPQGDTQLSLTGEERKGHCALKVSSDGTVASMLYDSELTRRFGLWAEPSGGSSGMTAYDQLGRNRITFGVGKDGIPDLKFRDPNGSTRIKLGTGLGVVGLGMADANQSERAFIGTQNGMPFVKLKDRQGREFLRSTVNP